jgi:hypothetical protein
LPARALAVVAFVCLLANAGTAQPARGSESDDAAARALRDWGHTIGTLGYVYGAPLLELSIAEYRQTHGLARDVSAQRGLVGHLMQGGLATHETSWLATPDPDVLVSSAWLDLAPQPFVLWIPPMDGHWYSVQFEDAFTNDVATLSSRTIGSVGGWYLVAAKDWQGEKPPGLMMDEVRVATPIAWMLLRIGATRENAADFHTRYQAPFKLLPLDLYARNPKAAGFALPQAQPGSTPPIRATDEMRGKLDAFRVINHRLRQLAPAPGEETLLALFDRAGFGPHVAFEPAKLPEPLVEGLRSAARDVQKTIRDYRPELRPARHGWSGTPPALGAFGDDYLLRASAAFAGLGASVPDEIATARATTDADGRTLDGRNDYVIRFPPNALPPAQAFWTIAAYDVESRRLLETNTGRHSIGSPTAGLHYAADGGLDVYLSSDPPEDPERRANWLPVRHAPFFLVARIYQPLPAVLDGGYALPPVLPDDD